MNGATFAGLWGSVDGDWVDIGAAAFGILEALWRAGRAKATRRSVIDGLFNGAALFPFMLMMAAVISSEILTAIAHSRRVTFFLAGGIGCIWVGGEMLKD